MTATARRPDRTLVGDSPNRVGGIGRVTGGQAYLADLKVADALHNRLAD